MQTKQQQQPIDKQGPAIRPPEGCQVCWGQEKQGGGYHYGIFTSIPVYLVNGNKYTQVCYVAKCVNCGHIQAYGLQQGVYKLDGKKPNFGIAYWPEIRRNHINPDKFLHKVLRSERGPVYIELSEVLGAA